MPIWAFVAGTKHPICANMAIKAFCLRKVDLPAILGPVTNQIDPSLNSQSFGMKLLPLFFRELSTTTWRPP